MFEKTYLITVYEADTPNVVLTFTIGGISMRRINGYTLSIDGKLMTFDPATYVDFSQQN